MIAADTSIWIAFLQGAPGVDAEGLDQALADRQVLMVPVVLSELLSHPALPSTVAQTLAEVPTLEIEAGYWYRAGLLRARALGRGREARLGDALIARSCIDGGVSLLTRDRDLPALSETAGLGLLRSLIRPKHF
jgi:predicted nucleic acid-binding protein